MRKLLSTLLISISVTQLVAQVQIKQLKTGLYTLQNHQGKRLSKTDYSMIFPFSEGLALAIRDGKYGYLNREGAESIAFTYDAAWDFRKKRAKVCNQCQFDFNEGEWSGGSWGVIDTEGQAITPLLYQWIGDFGPLGMAVVKKNNLFGFINLAGKEAVPTKFENVRVFSEGLASVKKDGKWGFINANGLMVIHHQYTNVGVFSEGLTGVLVQGKWGFIDQSGKEIVAPTYKEVGSFQQGLAMVKKGEKYGFIDQAGKQVVKAQFDEVWGFSQGAAKVRIGGVGNPKYGFVSVSGDALVPTKFDGLSDFSAQEGISRTKVGGSFGYISKTGQTIATPQFSDAGLFQEKRAKVKKDGKWGFIDETGDLIIPLDFDEVTDFKDGVAEVTKDGEKFQIDLNGKVLDWKDFEADATETVTYKPLKAQKTRYQVGRTYFDWVGEMQNNLAKVNTDDKWGYIDQEGSLIVPLKYDGIQDFDASGLAAACIDCSYDIGTNEVGESVDTWTDGKWGLVNRNGVEVLPLLYEEIEFVDSAVYYVRANHEWQLMNAEGKPLISTTYHWIDLKEYDSYKVQKNNLWGLLDQQYKEVLPCVYNSLYFLTADWLYAKKDDQVGIISKTGKVIIPISYDELLQYSEGLFPVKKNGKWGFINKDNQTIIPIIYDEVEPFEKGRAIVKLQGDQFHINLRGEEID